MNYYDIEKIYDEMEQYLIDNIKRNLMSDMSSFHLKEEKKLGFDWEAWQTTKLRELKRYRKQNKNILHKYINNIDSDVADVLRREYQQGKLSAYKGFKLALGKGYKSSVKVKDSFFRINDRKLDALIKAVNNDFKKANQAVLRMTNDTYRQVIFEASMYNNTGVMTSEEAIKKAVGQFETRGINSIEYSNGSRHKISNYARMAIRTASTRAYLQGNGEFRKKIGETLVILSKHGTACELCQPWEGKVLIDDVYSGGTKKDGKYPLLSSAMKQGLYHPNCRHALGTYYPELSKKDNNEIAEQVEREENELQSGKRVLNNSKKQNNKTYKPVGKIDVTDEKAVNNTVKRIEKDIVEDVIENAYTILKNGDILHFTGTNDYVNIPKDLDLTNAIITHNHPIAETHYSLSEDDILLFLQRNVKELRGVDKDYIYYIKRTENIAFNIDDVKSDMLKYRYEALELSMQNKLDIDRNEYDYINRKLSRKYNFKYSRRLRR